MAEDLIACVLEGFWPSPVPPRTGFRTTHGIALTDQRRSTLFLRLPPRLGILKSPVVVLKTQKTRVFSLPGARGLLATISNATPAAVCGSMAERGAPIPVILGRRATASKSQ